MHIWLVFSYVTTNINIEKLKGEIESDEGCVYKIYRDTKGFKTFGIGHLILNDEPEINQPVGTPVSKSKVSSVFKEDINNALYSCIQVIPEFRDLPAEAQRILVNMIFNLGQSRFSKFHKMILDIKKRDWISASLEMENSAWRYQESERAERLIKRMRNIKGE